MRLGLGVWPQVLFQNDSVQTLLVRIVGILGPFDPAYLESGRYATGVLGVLTPGHFCLPHRSTGGT